MNLFIIKKVTVIYKAILNHFFFLTLNSALASEELVSFCFRPTTTLNDARASLEDILLPREKVFMRPEKRCMDVLTSADRIKLLEKYLRLRYTLVIAESEGDIQGLQNQHCQLELKKIVNRNTTNTNLQIGASNRVGSGANDTAITEVNQLLLGLGKPGVLAVGTQALYVECRKGATGVYQLTFSLQENGASRITTEVSVRANEEVNVGQVTRTLNDRNRTLGAPQTALSIEIGNEDTSYQLRIKE